MAYLNFEQASWDMPWGACLFSFHPPLRWRTPKFRPRVIGLAIRRTKETRPQFGQ